MFSPTLTGAADALTFLWSIDGGDPQAGGAELVHNFAAPGFHMVEVMVTDPAGNSASAFCEHLAYRPPTPRQPTSSTSIVYDGARNRVYTVNQDNDTVTAIDAAALTNVGELAVFRRPESLALAPNGKLWIVHQDDYAVAVVDPDRFVVEGGFRLPYASQPVGVAMSPTGDAAYISLMATGTLVKLDPETGHVLASLPVGPKPRGIAVSHDGADVYVTRFVSSDHGGEVVKVNAASMEVAGRIVLAADSETVDSPVRARGVPNYLFSVTLTPDGTLAWIPGKKDNIFRGTTRDRNILTEDTTVRPLVAVIDTATAQEVRASRTDFALRSLPVHVELSPLGELAFITIGASDRVEVRQVADPSKSFSAISDVGKLPRATVLTPQGRLFVQGSLSRDVQVFDVGDMLSRFSRASPPRLARISTVANDKVPAEVLLGKQIFHNSRDERMSARGYLSCGVCHFEGADDGRVYDFSDSGEGLRNTPTLLGRRGLGHGRLNWSGNLDEVHDFEHLIRDVFKGTGFIPDERFTQGTHDQPLGDVKAGLSPELDALAAYVTSLDQVSRSPFKTPDGAMTGDAIAGKTIFERLRCSSCHQGGELTDSPGNLLHDVGTIRASSGQRAGLPLLGIDTPTLLGVWETPPYLHDGSAPALRDVLLASDDSQSPHGVARTLTPLELNQLLAFLLQLDGDPPVRPLPFEASPPAGGRRSGGCTVAASSRGELPPPESGSAELAGAAMLFAGLLVRARVRARRAATQTGCSSVAIRSRSER